MADPFDHPPSHQCCCEPAGYNIEQPLGPLRRAAAQPQMGDAWVSWERIHREVGKGRPANAPCRGCAGLRRKLADTEAEVDRLKTELERFGPLRNVDPVMRYRL